MGRGICQEFSFAGAELRKSLQDIRHRHVHLCMMHRDPLLLSRRRFLELSAGVAGAAALGCGTLATETTTFTIDDVTLHARPRHPSGQLSPGLHALGLNWARDGFVYVPATYRHDQPAPLIMLLHGATRSSVDWSNGPLSQLVDDLGIILVGPDSRSATWDIVDGERIGRDVRFIDSALNHVFENCNVNPNKVALGGFSDGASYALSLGIPNGDLFSALMAFSPGFVSAAGQRGSPRIFVSHGTRDEVLPIGGSREMVPRLRESGYDVEFVEFDGPHTVTRAIARQAYQWFVTGR